MSDPKQVTLREYARMLRQGWVVIVVLTVLCAVAAGTFSLKQTPLFFGEAQLSFQEEGQSNAEAGVTAVQTQTAAQLAARGAETVLSEDVLRRAGTTLRTARTVSELRRLVKAEIDASSNLVTVQARSSNKLFAAALANDVARATVALQKSAVRQRFARTADRVEEQLRRLRRDDNRDDAALAVSFYQRIASLRTLSVNATPVRLTKLASVPDAAASPKPLRDAVFAGFIGLLLGVVFTVVRSSLDRRLHDAQEIQDELDLPIIGSIRTEALGRAPYTDNGRGPMSDQDLESFRILRTNLAFMDVDHPPRSIVVTSPLPEEGKSTVSASLALSMTAAGMRVLLVECDLRRPCLAGRLGIESEPGLSDHLGGMDVKEVTQVVTLPDREATGDNGGRPAAGLAVVTAGSRFIRPAEQLVSRRFRSFVQEAVEAYEVVVIDTPPMLPVADTLEIIPLVEGLLLCVRAEQTTRDQVRAASSILSRLPKRPTGIVVTGVKPGREPDYGYYSSSYTDKR